MWALDASAEVTSTVVILGTDGQPHVSVEVGTEIPFNVNCFINRREKKLI